MTADEFKRARKALGLSTYKMAAELGMSQRTILRYQSGRRAVSGPVAKLMERLLGDKGIDLDSIRAG